MKSVLISLTGAVVLTSTAVVAAPLNVCAVGSDLTTVEQIRLVCNQYGRCWHSRGPRYVVREYDSYNVRHSYGYYGGRPHYYRGDGYYGGPSVGFSIGGRSW